jgi:DNA-binding CsgD family transcriptional regulator
VVWCEGIMEVVSEGVASSALVGRITELAALDAALQRIRDGRPSAVLIGGEAGVGKSRLVSEFGTRAAAPVRMLSGYCLELSAEGLPFAPFTGVLRELVRELGADGVAALLPGQGARELARLLPELGEPGIEGDPGEARARMFEQLLALFGRLAEAGPVVLVIEDAHWSDRSTRDLLAFLIGNQQALNGVLIVVTFRSDELHRGHPLRPVLAELDRLGWVARRELPRLTRHEGRELMTCLLGREPAPELAERVFRRSEGNPLFIETLLRSDALLDPRLPESLRDLVLADVRRLPAETQRVLEVLGVAGQWSGHPLLAAVTGIGDDALFAALKPAVSVNVLVPDADGYAFRHALIREAILGEVLPGQKTQLHARLAEALAADPSLVPPGRAVIEQAHHWYAAHDTPRALASAWQAAAAAGRSLAYAEKLAMLARILGLWDTLPDAAQVVGASHVSVLEAAADAAADAGEDDVGIGFATAALKEIDAAEEPARAALMLSLRAELRWYLGRAEGLDDVREALRLVPAGAPGAAVRRRVLSWLGTWPDVSGRPEARAAADEALQLSRQAGDLATEAHALITLAGLDYREHGTLSLDLLGQARTLAEKAHAHTAVLRAAVCESDMLEEIGEHERAAQVARQGLARAREYGLARATGTMLTTHIAEPLVSLGRWDEAADLIEHALELSPPPGARAALLQLAGDVALARGDLPGAAGSAQASRGALAGFWYRDQNHLSLARLEAELRVAQDRAADALAVAEQALDRFALLDSPRYAWPLLAAGARACAAARTYATTARDHALAERARRLLDRLRGVAEDLDAAGPLQQAHRLTFAAEAARADAAGAHDTDPLAAWDAAAQAWDRLHHPYLQACALMHAAEAAMARGDRDDAAERLARAAPLADRLGAGLLREQIGSLARRARLGLPSGSAAEHALGIRGLTARETEVLHLVAAGCSNRDIAAELFISAKTASVHVSNILAKLNAASRTEAAAIARRAGLIAGDS